MADRRETVTLALNDAGFTTGMARAAASTKVLDRALDDLDGSQVRTSQSAPAAAAGIDDIGKSSRAAGPEIDRFSGRLRLITDAALTLGPALVPLGAAAVGGVAALSAQFGALAGGVGVTVLAMQGIGDGLKALNQYQLEPTAENLAKMREEFDKIGPAGADFVVYLDSIGPQLREIQNAAREGLFPGLQEGIEELLTRAPQVTRIVRELAGAMGALGGEAGAGLAGESFDRFFRYLDREAAPILMSFGRSLGNVTTGLANMLVGFAPITRDFSSGLERMTESFSKWSQGLANNDSFQGFLDYLSQSGPQAIEFLGALSRAVASLLEATAPIGSAVLPVLTTLANAFAAIAGSPIGAPLLAAAAGFVAFNRAATIGAGLSAAATKGLTGIGTSAATAAAGVGKVGGAVQALAYAFGGLVVVDAIQDNFDGLSISIEETRRKLLDLSAAGSGAELAGEFDGLADSFDRLADPNKLQSVQDSISGAIGGIGNNIEEPLAQFAKLDDALTALVNDGKTEEAAAAFSAIAQQVGATGDKQGELTALLPGYSSAAENAANATDSYADAASASAGAARREATAILASVDAMKKKRDAALAAFDAETRYRQALVEARKQGEKNNAGIKGDTKAALANRGAISELAAAWNNQSDAVRNNISRFREARTNFIETAVAMGVPREAARQLAREMLAIPKSKVIKVSAETQAASDALQRIIAQAASVPRTIRTDYIVNQINSVSRRANVPLPGSAEGNIFPSVAYANGGMDRANNHQPELYRTPITRVWGEPETGGEAYIPLANDYRRPRARSILEATATELGGKVAWHADGALYGGYSRTSPTARLAADADYAGRKMREFGQGVERGEKGLKAELVARQKLLEKALAREEKEQAASKERLDALRQDAQSLRDSVASRLTSELFQQRDRITLDRPEGYDKWSIEAQQRFALMEQQLNANATISPLDTLRGDIERAREEGRLIQQLQARGLDGAALQSVIEGGNLSSAAALSRKDLRDFERLYNQRERAVGNAGESASAAVFGRELRLARKDYQEQTAEVREVKQQQRETNRRLERLEKAMERAADKAADKVGDKVNSAMVKGDRGR